MPYKEVDMERILRAAALAGLAALTACGTVEADRGDASPLATRPTSSVDPTDPAFAPDEILGLLPRDTNLLAFSQGDINADGRLDVVVALENSSETAASDLSSRSLQLFLRDAQGHLRLAATNSRIVPCETCGGLMGMPTILLETASGSFMLRTEGGTGWLWSNEYSFTHRGNNRWELASVVRMATHRVSHETTVSEHAQADFGVIDFVEFDPDTIEGKVQRRE